ncbi:MAG: TonB-dependent receptor, partial [Pseudomonadota bacterium]
LARDELVAGLSSAAVSGNFDALETVRRLLEGTGLQATVVANGAILVARDASEATTEATEQGMDAASSGMVETVVVIGTKQGLPIQDTQTSVSVTTMADIEEQVLFTVEDVLLRTANVSTGGDGTLNALSVRGISLIGVGSFGSGQTASVYVDGSPNSITANQGAANLWDVAQIEILRGPQSTVQGRNALAGAVVISTADPSYVWAAEARAIVGNEHNRQYSATLNVPVIDNQLAFRVAADYREIDFEVINVNSGQSVRFQEAFTGRAKALWEPSDSLRLELGFSTADTELGAFNTTTAPGPIGTPAFDAFDPFGRLDFQPIEAVQDNTVDRSYLDITYEINSQWTIQGLGTYEETDRNQDLGAVGSIRLMAEVASAELRAVFDYGHFRGWIGAYWYADTSMTRSQASVPISSFRVPARPPTSIVTFQSDASSETENRALFANVTYDFNERWSIDAGLRYDEEDGENTGITGSTTVDPPDCIFDPAVPNLGGLPCALIIPPSQGAPTSASFNAWLPRASIIYRFDELQSLSLNFARGYRAGGSALRSVPGQPIELMPFDPEYLNNFELAWRSEWPRRKMVINANA